MAIAALPQQLWRGIACLQSEVRLSEVCDIGKLLLPNALLGVELAQVGALSPPVFLGSESVDGLWSSGQTNYETASIELRDTVQWIYETAR